LVPRLGSAQTTDASSPRKRGSKFREPMDSRLRGNDGEGLPPVSQITSRDTRPRIAWDTCAGSVSQPP
jgi:hypothetical protein